MNELLYSARSTLVGFGLTTMAVLMAGFGVFAIFLAFEAMAALVLLKPAEAVFAIIGVAFSVTGIRIVLAIGDWLAEKQ